MKNEKKTKKQTLNYREQTPGYQRGVDGGMFNKTRVKNVFPIHNGILLGHKKE